jgi:hypothetical protein
MRFHFNKYIIIFLFIGFSCGASAKQSNFGEYEYLTQDSISLVQDVLEWNGEESTDEEIQSLIKSSYSLHIRAYDPDYTKLLTVLKIVKDSGIEDQLIVLNLHGVCGFGQTAVHDQVSEDDPVTIAGIGPSQFSRVYEELLALNLPTRSPVVLLVELRQLVEIKAEVVEILDDGAETILSSPMIGTKPGNISTLGVQDIQSGTKDDLYQQNGRSGGGTSFRVLPQFIGDHIKLTGSISMKRIKETEAFKVEQEPMCNYSTETITIPFAYVFDKNTDSVELDPIEIGGKKIICRLQAYRMSDQGKRIGSSSPNKKGMSRKEREKLKRSTAQ